MERLIVAKRFRFEVFDKWKLEIVQTCSNLLEWALIRLKILLISRFEQWIETIESGSRVLIVELASRDIIPLEKLQMNKNSPIEMYAAKLSRRKNCVFQSGKGCNYNLWSFWGPLDDLKEVAFLQKSTLKFRKSPKTEGKWWPAVFGI